LVLYWELSYRPVSLLGWYGGGEATRAYYPVHPGGHTTPAYMGQLASLGPPYLRLTVPVNGAAVPSSG